MKILGLSALFHDASAAFVEDEKIIWAGHAERYNGKKLTKHLYIVSGKQRIPHLV